MSVRTRTRTLAGLAAVALVLAGVWWGGHPRNLPGFLRNTLVADHQNRVLNEAIHQVLADYYRPVKRAQLLDSSIAAMIASLNDRFSAYLNPRQYAQFNESSNQQFSGIGVNIEPSRAGERVVEVFDNSPAVRAGIVSGDVITAANHRSLAGISAQGASDVIKGRPGTDVILTILHGLHRRDARVARAEVSVPVVASRLRAAGKVKIADVALDTFSSGAHGELRAAIERLLHQGAKAIVFDLRGNGGGLVEEARLVASIFLPDGPIVTTRARNAPAQTLRADGTAISTKLPVAVLVNQSTASSAEIVAGALQDRHRATIVGTHTFGKGVFQEVKPLSNGGALDITVGEYFLPSGRNLGGGGIKRGIGITPDVIVKAPRSGRSDLALNTALGLLASKAR